MVPHVGIIGDSLLRGLPHEVQDSWSIGKKEYIEFGRSCLPDEMEPFYLTTSMVNPGGRIQDVCDRVFANEQIFSSCTHVVTMVGMNDIDVGKEAGYVQYHNEQLHNFIRSKNPNCQIIDVMVPPSWKAHRDGEVKLINKMKRESGEQLVLDVFRRGNKPEADLFAADRYHLSDDGKDKLLAAILVKVSSLI